MVTARAAVLATLTACVVLADVRMPTLLADHMVVQRGVPVEVWGKADPGEAISVTFRGAARSASADQYGQWSVTLPPGEAGGPFEITVKGRNTIVLRDVHAGDVWVAAGQSNMEWPLKWAANPEEEIAATPHPRIRLFRAMHRVSDYPLDDLYGKPWAEASPASAADFSAAAYHFARDLETRLGIPIGVIQTAWGGTPADAWTSLRAIAADPGLMPSIAEWAERLEQHPAALWRYEQQCREWDKMAARARAEGKQPPPVPVKPPGPNSPWKPGGIYNAMVAPMSRFPIRGVIWYQGEANTAEDRAPIYANLFRTMILDWRRAWRQGDFPFLFVQLANFRAEPGSMWPEVRDAQRQTLALARTAMVVAIDIGEPDNIHPKNKREVGRRLALAARAVAYGESIEYSGPLFRRATPEAGALRLWFDHAGSGLVARGGRLRGFEIAGPNRSFVPAEARIDGATVVVSSASVPDPVHVRYGWADNPDCNLYNGDGLPASPFR